jgi:5-methylcytosine-specific restriction protein A
MPRALPEWIGKTADTRVPPRVKQRVFERDGKLCHLCGCAIKSGETWDADHKVALINGGENRETNLAPAHKHCHLIKSARDSAEKAKIAKKKMLDSGALRPAGKLSSAPFSISTKTARRKARANDKQAIPPRALYAIAGLGGHLMQPGETTEGE